MKTLFQFIKESESDHGFVSSALEANPCTPVGVRRFYSVLIQNGVCMHVDDSYHGCTFEFTNAEADALDEWVQKAYECFGDDLYDMVMEVWSRLDKDLYAAMGKTYECINRGSSCFGTLAKGFQGCAIRKTRPKVLFESVNEGLDYEFGKEESGGIIVLSTDVNAVKLSENMFVNKLKQKVSTIVNRFTATKKIDSVAKSNDLVAWTIGKYFSGRYTAKNGKAFGENSLSVEIIGVKPGKLIKIAEELCRTFKQETVLVKTYEDGKILLVNPD